MDYSTEESIGDFIDEPFKSSQNQNELFAVGVKTNWLLLSQPLLVINEGGSDPWPTFKAILVTQTKIFEEEERLANEAWLHSPYFLSV